MPKLKNQKIYGIIDRLIVGSNNVQIIDFKTNSTVPKTANKIPLGDFKFVKYLVNLSVSNPALRGVLNPPLKRKSLSNDWPLGSSSMGVLING